MFSVCPFYNLTATFSLIFVFTIFVSRNFYQALQSNLLLLSFFSSNFQSQFKKFSNKVSEKKYCEVFTENTSVIYCNNWSPSLENSLFSKLIEISCETRLCTMFFFSKTHYINLCSKNLHYHVFRLHLIQRKKSATQKS